MVVPGKFYVHTPSDELYQVTRFVEESAVVIKSSRHYPQATDKPAFDIARRQALKMIMDPANVTAPKKGGSRAKSSIL